MAQNTELIEGKVSNRPVYLEDCRYNFIINADKIIAIEKLSTNDGYQVYVSDDKYYFISNETYKSFLKYITSIASNGAVTNPSK